MIRNIIWDVDGTLFDTYPAISQAFRLAVNEMGGDAPMEWIMENARISLGQCVRVLAQRCGLAEDEVGQRFDQHYDRIPAEEQEPFAGVVPICQYICATGGKNVIVSHRGRQGVAELLEAHCMTSYFAGAITSSDGFPKKPNPASFEAAIELHQLLKAETIAVGDREIDIQAGQGAGVLTCLFDPDSAVQTAADLHIAHFDELLAYLIAQKV